MSLLEGYADQEMHKTTNAHQFNPKKPDEALSINKILQVQAALLQRGHQIGKLYVVSTSELPVFPGCVMLNQCKPCDHRYGFRAYLGLAAHQSRPCCQEA